MEENMEDVDQSETVQPEQPVAEPMDEDTSEILDEAALPPRAPTGV